MFLPTLEAAQSRMEDFLPGAGRLYASNRNIDTGPGNRENVSQLSPWVRVRLLPEWTVIEWVLKKHSPSVASKFIDEVCWRTYWKGWLQLRPAVWEDYLKELKIELSQWGKETRYRSVILGQSGIECMDAWTQELIETGYLHNHARMWYASIWIHTLKLPWVLGAAFFLTHLLDGDAASNTLSWRWVAGLHTQGKTYLARPDNIHKYTNGRFAVNETLAEKPFTPDASPSPLPKPRTLSDLEAPPKESKLGLLIQEDDLAAIDWLIEKFDIYATAGLFLKDIYETHRISEKVADFRIACIKNTLPSESTLYESIEAVVTWAESKKLDAILMAEIPIGLWNQTLTILKIALEDRGIKLYHVRHWWDAELHPHAKAGFFRFRQAIPKALSKINR